MDTNRTKGRPWQRNMRIVATYSALLTCIAAPGGCELWLPFAGGPSISDGELKGIGGWDVQASINVEPNQGPQGTPITITVSFSRGASHVATIEVEDRHGSGCDRLSRTWRRILNKQSDSRWETSVGRWSLNGNHGILRFVAVNSAGTRIAIGDVQINDGCQANAREIVGDTETDAVGVIYSNAE